MSEFHSNLSIFKISLNVVCLKCLQGIYKPYNSQLMLLYVFDLNGFGYAVLALCLEKIKLFASLLCKTQKHFMHL